ncbi:hypothetical protein P4O66_000561 [Electrophorus voltai]|uniref:Integrase catalytic domain-containing protein n=1 Tax=Electrophorus voltai TaxID=2609070 RepID=A0AAD8ZEN4_9TELE|nr:hypothetical protein P4O66_000561 [Electrophorus voltai]
MEPDVRAFVNSCRTCTQCKDTRTRPAGLLHPLPPSSGNMVILVVVDRFSKAGCFFALPKLQLAKEMAQFLLTQVVRLHGLPSDIVSDHGPQFTSQFWGAFCQLFGAEVSFHPQFNGQTERVNQDLERALHCLASSCPSSWSEHLLWVEFTHNTLWHSSLGMSPFEYQFRYALLMFADQETDVGVRSAEKTVRR